MSHDAYRRTSAAVAGPRDTEYQAFAEATRRLIEAEAGGRSDLKALGAALHLNRELWSTLAADCASAQNKLPHATRAGVIALARWVSQHTSAAIRGGEGLEPLIEVNRMIMEGLASKAPAA